MKALLFGLYRGVVSVFAGTRVGELYPIAVAHRYVISHLKPPHVQLEGRTLFLDPQDSLNLSLLGAHEPLVTRVARDRIRPGDVVLDIGAHIGYYTTLFARLVGERGTVFAFEPDPDNFALLERNVERNGCRNVVLLQRAVCDRNGRLRLYRADDNSGDHRTWGSGGQRVAVDIEGVRLDDYFEPGHRVDFIKMDIQGAELFAARGMERLLRDSPQLMLMTELWPWGMAQAGASAPEYLHLLTSLGFELLNVDERQGRVEAATAEQLLAAIGSERHRHTNVLCVRGSVPSAPRVHGSLPPGAERRRP